MTEISESAPIDAAKSGGEGRRLKVGTKTYLYVSLLLVAGIVIIPLITTALGGFKTLPDLRGSPFGLPDQWQWSNYTDILMSKRYWLQMGNSLLIAVLTVFLTIVFAACAAFWQLPSDNRRGETSTRRERSCWTVDWTLSAPSVASGEQCARAATASCRLESGA